MSNIKIVDLKKNIIENNDADAQVLRDTLKNEKIFYINIMSSPGSGKTTTILRTIDALKDKYKIGVMEADIDSDVDAETVLKAGVDSIQLHTGGMCHLDADMSRQGMRELPCDDYDIVILENVGNLVCPAEFDTGAELNVAILSVPEGHDKPLKYPLMFERCQVVLINKSDAMPAFDFDYERAKQYIFDRNPRAKIFLISAKNNTNIDEWCEWLEDYIKEWNK